MLIFNTVRVLLCRLVLEEYVLYIEYIQRDRNIVANALSRFPLNGN